ncbi:MAG: hypothetical protein SFY92_09020, partial [Verrucomicrobiae bacterium]|nr:hypothetical protein [Verrucomicrobiae bacterium]
MADYTIANGGSLLLGGGTLSNTTTVGGPQYGYYGGFQATSDLFTGYLTGGQIVATGLQAGWTLQTFNTG